MPRRATDPVRPLRPDRSAAGTGLALALALHAAALVMIPRAGGGTAAPERHRTGVAIHAWLWRTPAAAARVAPIEAAAVGVRLRTPPELPQPDWAQLAPPPVVADTPAAAPDPVRTAARAADWLGRSPGGPTSSAAAVAAAELLAARQRDARLQQFRQEGARLGRELAALGIAPADCPQVNARPHCPADTPTLPADVLADVEGQRRAARARGLDERALPPLY